MKSPPSTDERKREEGALVTPHERNGEHRADGRTLRHLTISARHNATIASGAINNTPTYAMVVDTSVYMICCLLTDFVDRQ